MEAELEIVNCNLNGIVVTTRVEPSVSLLDFIRSQGLTGAHAGCEHGVCGACTVLLNNLPVRSCIVLAVQADCANVETVESLGDVSGPSDLQESLSKHYGLQCGFCTPGFLMLIEGFLRENRKPDMEEIRAVLSSNVCRCTGYEAIAAAVEDVVSERWSR